MDGTVIASFKRYELKYLLTPEQKAAIEPVLAEHFRVDEYGNHTIMNIFFDTPDYEIIRTSVEKPSYKEKLRIRSYGVPQMPQDKVFCELKVKYDHVVYKRRIHAPLNQIERFLAGGEAPEGADPQITEEIRQFMLRHNWPKPKVCLCYNRTAMADIEDSNLRLTMDTNLRWRTEQVDLNLGSRGQPFIDPSLTLMEIKIPGVMPLWLARTLSENCIFKTSFSKIGTCYTNFLLPEYIRKAL